eukprot:m.115555 g.115555  ORF g.115555 m.115555 type:complete len:129 (+) comp37545_c0_seq12:320-706(+)
MMLKGDRDVTVDDGFRPFPPGPAPQEPSVYGTPVPPDDAPDAIKKAMASLPPEQMYELMKQMKLCIRDNPEDARRMLLQNPQLAYALLQAQLTMKIIDPKVADVSIRQYVHIYCSLTWICQIRLKKLL